MDESGTFKAFITEWQGERSAAECGRILGKSSQAILDWRNGASVPPRPSRALLAPMLGLTVEALTALIDVQRPPAGIRIDTTEEAQAWIEFRQPVGAEQGG